MNRFLRVSRTPSATSARMSAQRMAMATRPATTPEFASSSSQRAFAAEIVEQSLPS